MRATTDNAARVHAALAAFGAPLRQHDVSERTFAELGAAYRFGAKPQLAEVPPPLRVAIPRTLPE